MRSILTFLILINITSVSWAFGEEIQTTINSESLGESRKVLVRLPSEYSKDTKKSFPVLITLNDEDNFKWASNIVEIQASRFGIEDMIVVGLPHSGNYSKDNYPFKKKGSAELNPQAQKYSKFIREEALPYIEKNYRTNGGRFIIGHSLSGLFVTNLFMQYPDMFSTYVILSPSVQHAPQLPVLLTDFFKENPKLNGSVYISLGDMEHQQIQSEYKELKKVFVEHAPSNLLWSVNYMDNTDHLLAAFKGTYDSLAWIYSDWYIHDTEMQKYSVDDYVSHYNALSKRLKYKIRPRERYLVSFSGFARKRLNDTKAAVESLKAAIYYYPESQVSKDKLEVLNK
ncbi:alpha/beta hydrolase [Aliikangiella sp. G2MR2-5]|uniref:alpha/beta hydrolase n=1 Tax=Aliikangiella sp. G2MR2-5 TaxID=2788943 RepID=UPI0018AAB150|nr:alpha/beta hydrolase-fold protein [Aliikangiella sp. G2MR2-5]